MTSPESREVLAGESHLEVDDTRNREITQLTEPHAESVQDNKHRARSNRAAGGEGQPQADRGIVNISDSSADIKDNQKRSIMAVLPVLNDGIHRGPRSSSPRPSLNRAPASSTRINSTDTGRGTGDRSGSDDLHGHLDTELGAGTRFVFGRDQDEPGLRWPLDAYDDLESLEEPVRAVWSADELLQYGIGDYTFLPGPSAVLGRGKFSVVYKVIGPDGREYALKHTPLHPHHPLISARLLREPTLLAALPTHPCLIGVEGSIRSPSHFYLVESFMPSHGPLDVIAMPVDLGLARSIMDQLVSVTRDCLHANRVCHRDLKPENILINTDGEIILLDLGLATQFSYSSPLLTTCCGSPAFHSPEVVDALNNPPGVVHYYGPELDIWCIGLIALILLTGRRYPIGAKHTDLQSMQDRVHQALLELGCTPWIAADPLWPRMRRDLLGFLDMDGDRRMDHFEAYTLTEAVRDELTQRSLERQDIHFKSLSFIPSEPKYCLRYHLIDTPDKTTLRMRNLEKAHARQVNSCMKYLLRCAGILTHAMTPVDANVTLLQCVLTLPPDSPHVPRQRTITGPSFLDVLLKGDTRRSVSLPPGAKRKQANPATKSERVQCIRFWVTIRLGDSKDSIRPSEAASRLQATMRRQASVRPTCERRSTGLRSKPSQERVISFRSRSSSRKRSPFSFSSRSRSSRKSSSASPGPDATGDDLITIRVSDKRCLEAVQAAITPACLDPPERGRRSERKSSSEITICREQAHQATIEIRTGKDIDDPVEVAVQEVKPPRETSPEAGWFASLGFRPEYVSPSDRPSSASPAPVRGMLFRE